MRQKTKQLIKYLLTRELGNHALALGICYGICLGLTPRLTPQWLFLFLMVFILRVNLITTFTCFGLTYLCCDTLYPWLHAAGMYLLVDVPVLIPLWRAIYQAPVLPYFQLNNSVVLGTTVLCLFLLPLLFLTSLLFFRRQRSRLRDIVHQSYLWRSLSTQRVTEAPGPSSGHALRAEVATSTNSASPGIFRVKGFIPMGVVIGAALVYFSLFFDSTLHGLIEGKLSKVNGAPVRLKSVRTNFVKGEILLEGIEAWLPASDKNEALKISDIKIILQMAPLLSKHLIVEKMEIHGVGIGVGSVVFDPADTELQAYQGIGLSDRVATGFFEGLRSSMGENPFRRIGILLSGLDLSAEVQRRVRQLSSTKQLAEENKILESLEQDTGKLLAEMPDITPTLKSASTGKASPEMIAQLREAEGKLSKWLETTEQRLETGSQELGKINDAIAEDIKALTTEMNLPRFDGNDLTRSIVGPTLLNQLSKLTYWIDLSRRKMGALTNLSVASIAAGNSYDGNTVHYAAGGTTPSFHLKKATIDSNATSSIFGGEVKGTLSDLTTDPVLIGRPFILEVKADFPKVELRNLSLKVEIDHVNKQNEKVQLQIASLPVDRLAVNDAGDLKLSLSGRTSLSVEAAYTATSLKAAIDCQFQNVEFQSSSRFRRIEETVLQSVRDLNKFRLTARAEGPFDKPVLEAKSELGVRISKALFEEFRHQIGAIEDDLKKNILDRVYPDHQVSIRKYSDLKNKTTSQPISQLELIQDLRQRAEKSVARMGRNRSLAGARTGSSSSPPGEKPRPSKKP